MSQQQLQLYGERRLPPAEFLVVAGHLEQCSLCYRNFSAAFPDLTNPNQPFVLDWDELDDSKPFHLNYDEHLKPFVEDTIDAVDREIVESHVEVCPVCAKQLRELSEFREVVLYRLQARAAQKAAAPGWAQRAGAWWHRLWPLNPALIAVGLAMLVLGGGLGWWWLRGPAHNNEKSVALHATPDTTAPAARQPTSPTPESLAPADPSMSAGESTAPDKAPPRKPAPPPPGGRTEGRDKARANQPDSPRGLATSKSVDAPLGEVGNLLAAENVPAEYRSLLAAALQRQKVVTPPELTARIINHKQPTRGPGGSSGTFLTSPLGTVVRDARPVLRWAAPSAEQLSYIVRIYDESSARPDTPVAQSGTLSSREWQPPTALARGHLYSWEVVALKEGGASLLANSNGSLQASFKVLDDNSLAEVAQAEKRLGSSRLGRGLVYAQAGLLDEAETELKAWQQTHRSSARARKLVRRLTQLRN